MTTDISLSDKRDDHIAVSAVMAESKIFNVDERPADGVVTDDSVKAVAIRYWHVHRDEVLGQLCCYYMSDNHHLSTHFGVYPPEKQLLLVLLKPRCKITNEISKDETKALQKIYCVAVVVSRIAVQYQFTSYAVQPLTAELLEVCGGDAYARISRAREVLESFGPTTMTSMRRVEFDNIAVALGAVESGFRDLEQIPTLFSHVYHALDVRGNKIIVKVHTPRTNHFCGVGDFEFRSRRAADLMSRLRPGDDPIEVHRLQLESGRTTYCIMPYYGPNLAHVIDVDHDEVDCSQLAQDLALQCNEDLIQADLRRANVCDTGAADTIRYVIVDWDTGYPLGGIYRCRDAEDMCVQGYAEKPIVTFVTFLYQIGRLVARCGDILLGQKLMTQAQQLFGSEQSPRDANALHKLVAAVLASTDELVDPASRVSDSPPQAVPGSDHVASGSVDAASPAGRSPLGQFT